MKFKIFILSIFLYTCNSSQLEKEILALETIESKEDFLLNLFADDQKYRNLDSKIVQKGGYDSKEHLDNYKKMNEQDAINLLKTKTYLEIHGYPSCKIFKAFPCSLLVYIVGHQGDFEKQKDVYDYFYKAYKNNDLDKDSFLWIVDEMYESKFGIHYPIPPSYKIEERIEELMTLLELKNDN